MNFVSLAFLAFLLVTVMLFYALPSRARLPLLLVASYLFYATWSIPFIAIIMLTTTTDYWMSRIIHCSQSQAKRRTALVMGLVINLLILAFFKYCNFFLSTSHGLAHMLGYQLTLPPMLQIILPLGISFYTFEAISYMVDVYRGGQPARNWLDYNFYIMYFPHLISGPIVRFTELFPQYARPLELPSIQRIAKGFELILLGYAFKVFIADNAAPMVDTVFQNPAHASVFATYLAAIAFTVQIYFDFMGYTHIARGASLLFNIEMPLNFNHPYHATNISNFWERWHMSLSRWIRDYLYFPLGGSRGTLAVTFCNLLITMLICGAWHGAGWTFIAWGGYHGLLLGGYHVFKHFKKGAPKNLAGLFTHPLYQLASMALTFITVVLGWVLFRAPDFNAAAQVFLHLGNLFGLAGDIAQKLSHSSLNSMFIMLLLLLCCFAGPWAVKTLERAYRPLPYWAKVQIACLLAILCWIFTAQGIHPFIYFQF